MLFPVFWMFITLTNILTLIRFPHGWWDAIGVALVLMSSFLTYVSIQIHWNTTQVK